jgi:uncharacterized protein YehS (DUF1456 family)
MVRREQEAGFDLVPKIFITRLTTCIMIEQRGDSPADEVCKEIMPFG